MAIFILTKAFGAGRLKGDSPTFDSCFLEGWRRCLLLRWCLTSAWVTPDLLDITTCCTGSLGHSLAGSSTVGCFMVPKHARQKGQMQSFSSFMHPLCSWAVRAPALPRAGAEPERLGPPCPAASGGSAVVHRARLHTGEPVPKPHTRLEEGER